MATVAEIGLWLATDKNAPRHLEAVLSHQTPEVRAQVREIIKDYDWAATGGRVRPFQEPVTTKQVNERYGLDPNASARVYQTMEDNSVTTGLQQRLGTDAGRPPPETSLRDHIAAACDVHVPLSKE